MRLSSIQYLVLIAGLLVSSAAPATTLDVKTGWDGNVRNGRWMPIFITASHPKPTQGLIELAVPQRGSYVMQLRQFVALGPQETTVILYAPAAEDYGDPITVVLRDAESGKTLARWPADDADPFSRRFDHTISPQEKLVGVTGSNRRLDTFQQYSGIQMRAAPLKQELLPDQVVGYDPLDLLVLNRADLNSIEPSRQQAIADWVRAGGMLLLWPSDEPTPTESPIGRILPARIGAPKDYAFSEKQRRSAGFVDRIKGMMGFELTPTADAQPLEMLDADPAGARMTAYARQHGFGRVIVSPVNLNDFYFNSTSDGTEFHRRVLGRFGDYDPDGGVRSYYGHDPATQLQSNAMAELQDHLANVPGAGRFGFSYVVWVVLGMMAVVGPIDWFVLRKLGRQPWTWVTTAGWISLITVGALYIGKVFKSGNLHYRTVTLIDQAGDQVVARTTLAGIYSPQTTEYHLDAPSTQTDATGKPVPSRQPPAGWWETVSAAYYGGGGMKTDVDFRQTTEGNLPQPMTINVWNMRALRGENLVAGEPLLRADLSVEIVDGQQRLMGTIANLSNRPLAELRVVVGRRYVVPIGTPVTPASPDIQQNEKQTGYRHMVTEPSARARTLLAMPAYSPRIEPGQTVKVLGELRPISSATGRDGNDYYYDRLPPKPDSVWAIATGLAGRRSLVVDQAMEANTHAVIYARLAGAPPPAVLRENEGAIEQHETVLRVLTPLRQPIVPE